MKITMEGNNVSKIKRLVKMEHKKNATTQS